MKRSLLLFYIIRKMFYLYIYIHSFGVLADGVDANKDAASLVT